MQLAQHLPLPLDSINPSCRCYLRVDVAVSVAAAVLYMAT